MEFKYRSIDYRQQTHATPSTSVGYFSDQAMRVPNFMHNPMDMYAIQREIEKEKIRREILASERLLLEEEVRRELMMEREMAFCRPNPMGPFAHQRDNRFLQDSVMFPGNYGMGFGLNANPPSLARVSDVIMDENKSALEVNKEKLIMLDKPDPNLCGSKRKAEYQLEDGNEFPLAISKKKPKDEWRCDICRVSATCHSGLNAHLEGKKHKAKVRKLSAQKKRDTLTLSMAKESGGPAKPKEENKDTSLQGREKKVEEGLPHTNEGLNGSEKKTDAGDNLEEQSNDKVLRKRKWNVGNKKRNEVPTEKRKRNFKFFCELCQVGAYSEAVMDAHKKGKKHMAQSSKPNQIDETDTNTNNVNVTTSSEPIADKVRDEEVMVKEETKKAGGSEA